MALVLNTSLNTDIARPELPGVEEQDSRLNVFVIFTSIDSTISALRSAGNLAESLGARLKLVVPQVVPYPLPLTSPPVLLEFQENRFRKIASESPVDVQVQLYLCRDRMETLKKVLSPHSLLVIGARKRRFWPTREKRVVRKLRGMGHEVIFTETD